MISINTLTDCTKISQLYLLKMNINHYDICVIAETVEHNMSVLLLSSFKEKIQKFQVLFSWLNGNFDLQ